MNFNARILERRVLSLLDIREELETDQKAIRLVSNSPFALKKCWRNQTFLNQVTSLFSRPGMLLMLNQVNPGKLIVSAA